ncbi:Degenerin-like protein asic-1 [Labeo rohita]|uniref:Degenerin-like protein asic-1 n=1 Tax=Labeo rohita TaxID=84645 RepID=A0ABQ8MZD5_LABRO|nr:Degenerin-like protein asic-1 [Labeo rohita]
MGKTADLTVVQKTIIDTLHKEGKSQTFIAKEAGCSQSAVSKHVNRKLNGRKKCGRKRCTTNRENCSLERLVKQNRFKNLGELHKEWTEAGVKASRATTHRRVKEFGCSCRIPLVKPLLNHRQRQRRPKSSFQMRASFVFHLETKVLESGGRVDKLRAQVA